MTSCRKLSVRSPLRYKWRISLNFISGFLTLRSYKFGLEVHLRFPYFKKLHVWSWKNVERRRSSVFKESSFPCVWLFSDSFQFSHACLMMIVFKQPDPVNVNPNLALISPAYPVGSLTGTMTSRASMAPTLPLVGSFHRGRSPSSGSRHRYFIHLALAHYNRLLELMCWVSTFIRCLNWIKDKDGKDFDGFNQLEDPRCRFWSAAGSISHLIAPSTVKELHHSIFVKT